MQPPKHRPWSIRKVEAGPKSHVRLERGLFSGHPGQSRSLLGEVDTETDAEALAYFNEVELKRGWKSALTAPARAHKTTLSISPVVALSLDAIPISDEVGTASGESWAQQAAVMIRSAGLPVADGFAGVIFQIFPTRMLSPETV